MIPGIDHLVVDVEDRMDEAARRYEALGFRLTPLGRHTLGSVNRLAVLAGDYLELLGTGEPGAPVRPDLAGFPAGMNGLVFRAEAAEAWHGDLTARGLPAEPVQSFSRPVEVAGRGEAARFKVVRLAPRAMFDGRVYFCEHLTPELVWRPEWQDHPNGAFAIARVAIAARDPDVVARRFSWLFGREALADAPQGGALVRADAALIEIRPAAALAEALGEAMPDPAGRGDHVALVGLRVRSLGAADAALQRGRVAGVRREAGRILVAARAAVNVAVEFTE
jgi:hypothetical protein